MQPEFIKPRALDSSDAEYRFGRPKVYLTAHEIARLTLLRSRLGETARERAAEQPLASRKTGRIADEF